jgi:hypothetical protein
LTSERIMSRLFLILSLALAAGAVSAAGEQAKKDDLLRVEFVLKTPRSRDPVLGGARDKVFVSVWLPDGVKSVRGAICNPFSKGDSVSAHWQAVCRHWQFAYVQTDFDAVKKDEFALLQKGLAELAKKAGRPELEHMPLCFTGMSRGGGMSMQLAELLPERTLASVPVCLEVGPGSDATRRIPVLTIFGEKDGKQMAKLLDKLPAERKQGARYSIAVQWAKGHEFARANNISFVFLDDVIQRRLPKENDPVKPVRLTEIPLESGWLGDPFSWGKDGRRPTIAPWKEFQGERARACWFPTQRSAAVWQAFVAGTNDLVLTQPAGLGDKQKFITHPAGQPIRVSIQVADKRKPAKVILWDAHQRLAERSEAPWTFEVSLAPGVHSLFATMEEAGQTRFSRPNTIVVAK